eukprot:CAMPEP_0116046834 /NCGR_PEP_ID=MMETSP0321-20121206/28506_1 /TAXON_ID=163516 /ORGANISM="Leptocylindrus danicus var. danicus, Strain B650" /LENGTH=467 /DNA_ID=CAMNT_0003528547 /DNA_START=270 /DNA_END=1673 /DNA_ORIENTATION=-
MTDRYARINYGYTGKSCAHYTSGMKPNECLQGSHDAQDAVSISLLVSNLLSFVANPTIGSISDARGRKLILVPGIALAILPTVVFVIINFHKTMSPAWYFVTKGLTGLIDWLPIIISSMADILPSKWRAPCFGLLYAGFALGVAVAPLLALLLDDKGIAIVSAAIGAGAWIFTVVALPETLSRDIADGVYDARIREDIVERHKLSSILTRPIEELKIINRNNLFRLLAVITFLSRMVFGGVYALLVYYLQHELDFNKRDVAHMLLISGLLAIFVLTALFKSLNDLIGERRIIIFASISGVIQFFLFGIASSKQMIFVTSSLLAFVGLSIFVTSSLLGFVSLSSPTIAAVQSNNVEVDEQGHAQGALFSISSLAEAVGPLLLRSIYYGVHSRHTHLHGLDHGVMFIFASTVYLLAVLFAVALPAKKANSRIDKLTSFFVDRKESKRRMINDITMNDGGDIFGEVPVDE